MTDQDTAPLTDRQRREIEYHREHAEKNRSLLERPISWDVLANPSARWWNPYWQMYAYLHQLDLRSSRVLVVGCGFGEDALRIAKLGAQVSAFDLSAEALDIARKLADREKLDISFDEMPAEALRYADSSFDCIVARDILHHVDIPRTMAEIVRVAKPGAVFLVNEIYTHSSVQRIRRSRFVDGFLYERMKKLVYGTDQVYITEDERKLDENDLLEITRPLQTPEMQKHFNFFVTRILSDRLDLLAKVDRAVLRALRPVAGLLAGRVLFAARVAK